MQSTHVNAVSGRKTQQQSQFDDFAHLLEDLFAGSPAEPMPMPVLTEQPISVEERFETIRRLKQGKASDDFGLVAELLHHAPPTCLNALLEVLNHLLRTGCARQLAEKLLSNAAQGSSSESSSGFPANCFTPCAVQDIFLCARVRVRVRPESPKAARLGLRQGPYLQVCTKVSRGYMTRIKIAWQS